MTRGKARDWLAAVALAVLAGALSWTLSSAAESALSTRGVPFGLDDIWFGADVQDSISTVLNPEQQQPAHHPLEPLLISMPVRLIHAVVPGAAAGLMVRVGLALAAGVWVMLLFACLRLGGCALIDAAIFGCLSMVSATAVFWFAVPDRFLIGSITTLPAVAIAAAGGAAARSSTTIAATVLSFAMTTTNGMFGAAASAAVHSWRRAALLTAIAFAICLSLVGLQGALIAEPASKWLVVEADLSSDHRQPVAVVTSLQVLMNLVSHAMVMPAVTTVSQEDRPSLSVQAALPGSAGVIGAVATTAWALLLAIGAFGSRSNPVRRELRFFLGAALAGQLTLHLLFGQTETFLFAPHYAPLLILWAALGTRTRLLPLVRVLAVTLIATAIFSNLEQFQRGLLLARLVADRAAGVD